MHVTCTLPKPGASSLCTLQIVAESAIFGRWLWAHTAGELGMYDPWVRKTPWRREWLPTPTFLLEEFPGQRSLYSPWGCRVRHNWATTTFHYEHTETGFKSAGWGETTDLRFSIIFWNTKEAVSTHLVFCKIQRRHTALKFCHKKEVWSSCTHRKSDIASESQQGYGRYLSPEGH